MRGERWEALDDWKVNVLIVYLLFSILALSVSLYPTMITIWFNFEKVKKQFNETPKSRRKERGWIDVEHDTTRPLSLGKLMLKRSAFRLYTSGRERRADRPGSKSNTALIATFFFPRSLSTRAGARAYCKRTARISFLRKVNFCVRKFASDRRSRQKNVAGGTRAVGASARRLPILKNRTTMRPCDWSTSGLLRRDWTKVRAVEEWHLKFMPVELSSIFRFREIRIGFFISKFPSGIVECEKIWFLCARYRSIVSRR